MDESYVSESTFKATVEQLKAEDKRENERLNILEKNVEKMTDLTVEIHSLTESVKNMTERIADQNERLKVLENKDGEMWRTAVKYVVSALIGGVIAFLLVQLGMG
ncbi:MAG: hypothetical protein LUD50_02575 [Clostridia bacterium]|nr:hypothetical protein [Clostridia bacterium]